LNQGIFPSGGGQKSLGGNRVAVAELLDQLAAGAMDPGFYGAQGNVHRQGNFTIAQLTLVKQQKRLLIFGPQVGEGQSHFLGQMVGGLLIGTIVGQEFGGTSERWAAAAGSQGSAATVAGNRKEPGLKVALGIPTMQISQHADERFLRGILGVLPLTEHSITQAVNLTAKTLDERQHGRLIAGQATLDDASEVLQTAQHGVFAS